MATATKAVTELVDAERFGGLEVSTNILTTPAAHQTGWTALVALVLQARPGARTLPTDTR